MRKICIFTGTRAEYGLLRCVMHRIQEIQDITLQIIATGMHLSPEFGMTVQEIRADGFEVDETVEILLSGDTPTAICKSMGLGLIGYGEALQRLNPDMVVLLGDRFESFCMAAATQVCRVPLAHIHGGETTEGVIDEAFRHAITKMAHLHFASCEAYRQRIIQLGELPDRVFNVGAIGIENIQNLPLLSKEQLAHDIGFEFHEPYFLVTFHPVTLERTIAREQFGFLLSCLEEITTPEDSNTRIIFTKANSDTDGRIINQMIDHYVADNPGRAIAFTSMGQVRYLNAMKHSVAVVGNSSSGIIEAPSLKVPVVNIGDRQKGRIRAKNVIDCKPEKEHIQAALRKALSRDFVNSLKDMANPYEKPGTSQAIVKILKKIELKNIIKKKFYDIG